MPMRSLLPILRHMKGSHFFISTNMLGSQVPAQAFLVWVSCFFVPVDRYKHLGCNCYLEQECKSEGQSCLHCYKCAFLQGKGFITHFALPSDSQSYLVATLCFYAATFLPLLLYRASCCRSGGSHYAQILPLWRHCEHSFSDGINRVTWVTKWWEQMGKLTILQEGEGEQGTWDCNVFLKNKT